ncbi:MAG: type I pullulanase [Bacteroidota bacterium]
MQSSIFLTTLLFLTLMSCTPERPTYSSFDEYPRYEGGDLGMIYSPASTSFKLWSPAAQEARLLLYATDVADENPFAIIPMEEIDGAWTHVYSGDLEGKYYSFQIMQDGAWLEEAPDLYARAVGTNGERAQVIDLAATDPEGWETDRRPELAAPTDIILYELHMRDATVHASAGSRYPGKFLGLTERGTRSPDGLATGIDHLVELGVTHLHLLPVFDYASVDERPDAPSAFNWGYDPLNYNVPEGSYATDPSDGRVRVREFKQMVQALHQAGIRVVMDVVYNHTGPTDDSPFNLLVPGYYYRQNEEGGWSDASGCGNETASERPMVRDYIIESVKYWAREFHVDGFRFDLMGIHDIETMNRLSAELHEIDPSIFVYGEGWTAGGSPLPDDQRALKANTPLLDRIAAFSDDLRDGLKGSVFNHEESGFVSGSEGRIASIQFGVVAAGQHPQIDYEAVNYSNAPWAPEPYQCINYVSCHDNHTLWDRLQNSNPEDSEEERAKMARLALAVVLTSQGVPFLHAGSEMLRTKGGEENSYQSPDSVNAIDWTRKAQQATTVSYVSALIALRKAHPAFRLPSNAAIQEHLSFLPTTGGDDLVVFRLQGVAGDDWQDILVAYNASVSPQSLALPAGDSYDLIASGEQINVNGIGDQPTGSIQLAARAMTILKR